MARPGHSLVAAIRSQHQHESLPLGMYHAFRTPGYSIINLAFLIVNSLILRILLSYFSFSFMA